MELPGTSQHQDLLRAILAFYQDDPRILAIAIFGSLARGNWDRYSDLDLDIVIADGVHIEVVPELERLCNSLGAGAALVIPDDDDAGDVVLDSLMEFSIRYHPLASTSPAIVDSVRVLMGSLDTAAIQAAGRANGRTPRPVLGELLDRCIRYAVETASQLQREQFWNAVELLHRTRGLVMELYARTHGGARAWTFFQTRADNALQARLGASLPSYDLASARDAFIQLLDLLEHDLANLTDRQMDLTPVQRHILSNLRDNVGKIEN